MEFTGTKSGITLDLSTKKHIVSILANEDVLEQYQKFSEEDKLTITIKKYRNKRSLDANAYMWVLLSKLAAVLHTSKDELYLEKVTEYGVFTHIIVKPNMVQKVKEEWRTCRVLGEVDVNGETGIQIQCYFGSSTYDTAEMAELIDGIVNDCKDAGVETLPPVEIERMKREWGVKIEEKNQSPAIQRKDQGAHSRT